MKILEYGCRGPRVSFLQLALNRAGVGPVAADGVFGHDTAEAVRRFQQQWGIHPNGIAGKRTQQVLRPYYTGYLIHRAGRGETLYSIARKHHTSLRSLEAANHVTNAVHLRVGDLLTVPLSFPVVPTGIPWSSDVLDCVVDGLDTRYPFLRRRIIGRSVMGKPLYALTMGSGRRTVLYCGTHHGNEWITTPLLLQFAEELASAAVRECAVYNHDARSLLESTRFIIVQLSDFLFNLCTYDKGFAAFFCSKCLYTCYIIVAVYYIVFFYVGSVDYFFVGQQIHIFQNCSFFVSFRFETTCYNAFFQMCFQAFQQFCFCHQCFVTAFLTFLCFHQATFQYIQVGEDQF